MNDIACPQMRGIDGIKAMDPAFRQAVEGGVTTVCTGPGSANVLGGTFVAIKTVGRRSDDMVVKDNVTYLWLPPTFCSRGLSLLKQQMYV